MSQLPCLHLIVRVFSVTSLVYSFWQITHISGEKNLSNVKMKQKYLAQANYDQFYVMLKDVKRNDAI